MLKIYTNNNDKLPVIEILCQSCNPIIFQVFFSAYADQCVGDYEPDYFDFDFANNGYGKFIAALREAAEDKELMNDIYNATLIEPLDIKEVEKELVGMMPFQPERTIQSSYTYDHCAKGNACFHQQDYNMAIEHYKAAAERKWTDEIIFCLSLSYYLKGDYHNALAIASRYSGNTYEWPNYNRGMSTIVLDTTPIDKLNYLLDRRMTV